MLSEASNIIAPGRRAPSLGDVVRESGYTASLSSVGSPASFSHPHPRIAAPIVRSAVSMQPVTSVLKSNCELLMNYKEGVLTTDADCRCCETSCIDHAVVIVGYNTTALTPYWKVRLLCSRPLLYCRGSCSFVCCQFL